ncbi:thymidylate kinase [Rubidibacter lacunae KORDI 51-2]|uniref:Thymidylate kinase n=1 Tax=Rubidibacter lacunae KORDI 51-2 TaxID=582515 RepID=U5D9C4_9CHRO|nr:dTMP kinase [Rubidibacter lacunae]ERN41188.1 thymidylate kinase [Rubidibacter lacunae KORDI 51-2]
METGDRRGTFIVFEGTEGGGKSTQLQLARDWLERSRLLDNSDIVVTREPGGTALGRALRQLILTDGDTAPHDRAELLLYAADRAQHVATAILPALERGATVLCDRFTGSTIAYQGYGRGLDLDTIDTLNRIATVGLRADLTLWLDVSLEVGRERARARSSPDRMERNQQDFYARVRQGYAHFAATDPERVVRVDANGGIDDVHARIRAILSDRLARRPL